MALSKVLLMVAVAWIAFEVVSAQKPKPKVRWGVRFADNDTCHCPDDKPHHPPKHQKPDGHKPDGHKPARPRHHGGKRHHLPHIEWCKCLPKPTGKAFDFKIRILQEFHKDHNDPKSEMFKNLFAKLKKPLMKVLKPKRISMVKFFKGSVIAHISVEYDVTHPMTVEKVEKKLQAAIKNGEFKGLKMDEKSVVVFDKYSGVKLGQWETKDEEHDAKCEPRFNHKHHHEKADQHKDGQEMECFVMQHRHCLEVNNSCDDVPRMRKVSCDQGCSKMWTDYGCWKYAHGHRHKIFFLVGGIVSAVLFIAVLVALIRRKQVSVKYIKQTSSAGDAKILTDFDYCAGPLPAKTPLA